MPRAPSGRAPNSRPGCDRRPGLRFRSPRNRGLQASDLGIVTSAHRRAITICVVASPGGLVALTADGNRWADVVAVEASGAIVGEGVHNMRLSFIGMGVAAGAAAMSLGLGAGVASADPFDGVVNTTCSYPQVIAALNATNP